MALTTFFPPKEAVGLVWFVALVVSYGNPFARRRQTKHTNAMQTLTADDPDVGE
jgi:hypothetical protein